MEELSKQLICRMCSKKFGDKPITYFLALAIHEECLEHPIVKSVNLIGKGQSFTAQSKLLDLILNDFNRDILSDTLNNK